MTVVSSTVVAPSCIKKQSSSDFHGKFNMFHFVSGWHCYQGVIAWKWARQNISAQNVKCKETSQRCRSLMCVFRQALSGGLIA